MSYRHFKKLLGETSLERKCRFLLGTGILLLMTLSFWVYARQTEHLAYEQTATSARQLVPPIVESYHITGDSRVAMAQFRQIAEKAWPEALREYRSRVLKPVAIKPEHKPEGDDPAVLNRLLTDTDKREDTRTASSQGRTAFVYYAAFRAQASCLKCHPHAEERTAGVSLAEGDLMAVIRIQLPTEAIESGFHVNRALLISTALLTALLIMAGSYLIIRYVIVK